MRFRDGSEEAVASVRFVPLVRGESDEAAPIVLVLNFYSPVFIDQLKRGRKTATIRLGDKGHKYRRARWCSSPSASSTRRAEDLRGRDRLGRGEAGAEPVSPRHRATA